MFLFNIISICYFMDLMFMDIFGFLRKCFIEGRFFGKSKHCLWRANFLVGAKCLFFFAIFFFSIFLHNVVFAIFLGLMSVDMTACNSGSVVLCSFRSTMFQITLKIHKFLSKLKLQCTLAND